jgi:hypothetical protein
MLLQARGAVPADKPLFAVSAANITDITPWKRPAALASTAT